jgi:prolyl-tRNA synthetase
VREAADRLYQQACDLGIEVLLDDRAERPGVKFAEADLIGIPHRIVIGDRGLKSGVAEYRKRRNEAATEVALDQVLNQVLNHVLDALT